METLYDLLGALPNDDAENLRSAFRRAVKGTHPDINPGDPLAALRFRQIVRANEILNDPEQRAAYDHLMDLARIEQASMSKHAMARKIYKFASGVLAFAVILIMAVGGYAVYLHLAQAQYRLPLKQFEIPLQQFEAAVRQLPQMAATATAEPPADLVKTMPAEAASQPAPVAIAEPVVEIAPPPEQALAVSAVAYPADTGAAMAANLGLASDVTVSEARSFRERGITAYRSGDLNGAIADFDQAILLDPKFSAAYIDRGIVFYRLRKFDRAFADISRAKRLEKANRAAPATTTGTSSSAAAKKPRPQPGLALGAAPVLQRRAVGLD
jgi:tetratricopeptide (TPR) repeat protein